MDKTHLKHIGQNIKTMREYRKLSAAELGFKVGNTDRFIGKVEAGEIPLSIDQLVKIADKLNFIIDISFKPAENEK